MKFTRNVLLTVIPILNITFYCDLAYSETVCTTHVLLQIHGQGLYENCSTSNIDSIKSMLSYEKHTSQHLAAFKRQDGVAQTANNYLWIERPLVSDLKLKSIGGYERFTKEILEVAGEYNIDPLLIHAIAEVESAYNPNAVSNAGALGLMQIMPNTAKRYVALNNENELFDVKTNLRISSNYIRTLYGIFGNDIPLILAAYNAGENAVKKHGYSIPPYKETQVYVQKVMEKYKELKGIEYRF